MTADTPPSELAAHRPALRHDIELSGPLLHGTTTVHLVRTGRSRRTLLLGEREHFLITRLDGHHTLGDIGHQYAQHFGRALGDANWAQLLRLLWARGLMAGAPDPAPTPTTTKNTPLSGTLELIPDTTALTDRLLRTTGFALRPWILAPLLLAALTMETAIAAHLGDHLHRSGRLLHQPAALVAVGCALWISSALHELAHALAARRFGAEAGSMGLRWRLPVVIAYCDIHDLPFLTRRHQVATAAAGTVMNLLVLLPFWAVSTTLPSTSQAWPALSALLLSGSALALVNLVPLPPFDGYRMIGHALGVHRLAAESRRYLALRITTTLRRDTPARLTPYPRRARAVYTAYGLGTLTALTGAAVLWSAAWYRALAPHHGAWTAAAPTSLPLLLLTLTALPARRRHRPTAAATASADRRPTTEAEAT
ncbi:M50 family metallopeptidase [Kitasatospora sp. NPDC048540]|uniref:M50 family metallopeptidase n=1 Tax=Kitasatospora sp. NPDC048540 TaxID=3155634 RepID=UPI0033DBB0CA